MGERSAQLRSPDSCAPAIRTDRSVGDASRVPVVGDAFGCGRRRLARPGREIHALDIAPQPDVENLVVQSIEDRT